MTSKKNNLSTSAEHPNNKYLNWYFDLCNSRKYRGIKKEKGFQVHHIIPKCDGGDNKEDNLTKLTHREHFIAHVLLAKGTNSIKHWTTVRRMMGGKRKSDKGPVKYQPKSSILFSEIQKKAFEIAPGGAEKGRPKSISMRQKLSNTKKGQPFPIEYAKKAWEKNRGRKQTEEEKKRRSESAKKYWADKKRSDSHREIIRDLMTEMRKG